MTNEDIQKLGELAKIEINPEEAEGFKKDFESILGYINQIESVDISDGDQYYVLTNVMRSDVVEHESGEFSDDLLGSAPSIENGFIKVKKIL